MNGEESWVDDLELPRTEAALKKLISTATHTIRGLDEALNSGPTPAAPELEQLLQRARAKAEYCLQSFETELAQRRRLMSPDTDERKEPAG